MAYKIKSKSEYKKLRDQNSKYNKSFEVYRKKTKRNWINEEEAKKYDMPKSISNDKKSAIEVYEYKNKPLKKGEKYNAYLSNDGKYITTWTGDKLADVNDLRKNKSFGYEEKYSFEGTDINGKKIKGRAYAGKGGYVRFTIK